MAKIRLHLKLPSLELDYDGPEEFFERKLELIVEHISKLPISFRQGLDQYPSPNPPDIDHSPDVTDPSRDIQLSVNTVAIKLGATKGSDLTFAACVHLHFVLKKEYFSRKEILENMKNATSYFKQSDSKNLSHSLKKLTQAGKLNERNKNEYALHSSQIPIMEQILVNN
ncbi:MAG: hypothetical protein R3E39_12080 [Anaerolineae bacterium]